MTKRYVISLGGSLIVPEEIDVKFLAELRKLLAARKKDFFAIAPGGGRTARKYFEAAKLLGVSNSDDLDWLGIFAVRLNRLLLKEIFVRTKNVEIIDTKNAKPGQSSDAHAVEFAIQSRGSVIINLSNVDYVYDKNPKKYKDAKPLKNITWADFRKIVGNKWKAVQSWPFDPVSSREAEKHGLKVVFMNGKNLKNLENFLSGKAFKGTVIN